MKLRSYLIGFAPLLAVVGYIMGKAIWASMRQGDIIALIIWGLSLLIIALIFFGFAVRKHPLARMFTGGALVAFMAFTLLLMAIFEFRFLYFIFTAAMWGGVFGIRVLVDLRRDWRKKEVSFRISLRGRTKTIAGLLAMSITGTFLFAAPYYASAARTFQVTEAQAQSYDLVLYWGDQTRMNTTLVGICKEARATLSFNMPESFFDVNDLVGNYCATIINYSNQKGVKVEVWPLFDGSKGQYVGYNHTEEMMGLYDKFQAWVEAKNVTVDYLLWDIEEGARYDYAGWAKDIPVLGMIGNWSETIQEMHRRAANWTATLDAWTTVLQKSLADGHLPRATTNPMPEDLLDGDSDMQKWNGMPSFDIRDQYEYISMMIYRGCEWGGARTPEYVYQSVRSLHNTQPGQTAVCIGCINFAPYPTIASVQNDVRLALAAGADSIRIFQGQSWVDGAYGPANGITGLRDLLLAVRHGGSAQFTPDPSYELLFALNIIVDAFYDLTYV